MLHSSARLPMIENCHTTRDEAMLAVTRDSGVQSGVFTAPIESEIEEPD